MKLTIHLHKAICLLHPKMQREMGTQTQLAANAAVSHQA
jgi:hypothetical protein